jgi:RimK family alpha-L-glutamate ligase
VPASDRGAGLRVAVLGSTGGWHARRIERALTERGHTCDFAAVTRMAGRIDPAPGVRSREHDLDAYDAVLVRGIPRGSLEQVIFRVDALHVLQAGGVRVVNGATAIERTVDKFLASALLARAGVPTPRTVACERAEDAIAAFADLGGDVVVKPLFGSMGFGIARLEDPDVADRVFRALEIERAVYYLQETLAHDGRDLRAMVVGNRVLGAMERTAGGFRTNLARGGTGREATLTAAQEDLAVRATRALEADYAGVDLLQADGRDYVVEVNGIPGWQGFERATGIDVAAAIVDHLEARSDEATWAA